MTSGNVVCFGYQIESTVPLRYLRRGSGQPLLIEQHDGTWKADGGELLMDWPARPDRPVAIRLHRTSSGFGLWISDAGWFSIRRDSPEIALPPGGNLLRNEERLWGMPSILTFLSRGDFPLHAASVDLGGSAVLFGGPTRHGKTTLSAALWKSGYRVLSEDVTCVDAENHVVPGPTMVRLRHDVAAKFEDSMEVLGYDDERAHMQMSGDLADDASRVPAAAMVLLEVGDEIRVERVEAAEALPSMWILSFHIPTDEHERWIFQRLTDLVATIPVFRLIRPLRLDALPGTISELEGLANASS